jgi:hypothetical protein
MLECHSKTCKQRDSLAENCVIYIRWHDACHKEGPCYLNDIENEVIIESAGILVRETETHFSICQDRYVVDETFRHVTTIPKAMVVEIGKFNLEYKDESV